MPPMRSRVGLFCLFASLLATNLSLGDDDADNYGEQSAAAVGLGQSTQTQNGGYSDVCS